MDNCEITQNTGILDTAAINGEISRQLSGQMTSNFSEYIPRFITPSRALLFKVYFSLNAVHLPWVILSGTQISRGDIDQNNKALLM